MAGPRWTPSTDSSEGVHGVGYWAWEAVEERVIDLQHASDTIFGRGPLAWAELRGGHACPRGARLNVRKPIGCCCGAGVHQSEREVFWESVRVVGVEVVHRLASQGRERERIKQDPLLRVP